MSKPLSVGLLLFPGCMPAGLLAFGDMLHAANRRTGRALFATHYVALARGPVECAHGMLLNASLGLAEAKTDALLIPGFWAESAEQVAATLEANAPLLRALARLNKQCSLWSYCTGVSLVAAAGRLAGNDATVTWWLADTLRTRFPDIRWQTERHCIFTAHSATASGVNGYLPIAQALLERNLNQTEFHDLIRLMVLPRPIQAHDAFQAISLIEQPSDLLRRLHTLVQRLPAEQITLQKLAGELGLSERTLARRVGSETSTSVAAYARRIKLGQVGERLTFTAAPIKSISHELGFSSESNLRRMFKELTQLTPAEYRERFSRY